MTEEDKELNAKNVEIMQKGITIAFKCEDKEIRVESPLGGPITKDKNFLVLSTNLLLEDGTLTHVRKVMEIENGKKLK